MTNGALEGAPFVHLGFRRKGSREVRYSARKIDFKPLEGLIHTDFFVGAGRDLLVLMEDDFGGSGLDDGLAGFDANHIAFARCAGCDLGDTGIGFERHVSGFRVEWAVSRDIGQAPDLGK